jgi:hypothetical protein
LGSNPTGSANEKMAPQGALFSWAEPVVQEPAVTRDQAIAAESSSQGACVAATPTRRKTTGSAKKCRSKDNFSDLPRFCPHFDRAWFGYAPKFDRASDVLWLPRGRLGASFAAKLMS